MNYAEIQNSPKFSPVIEKHPELEAAIPFGELNCVYDRVNVSTNVISYNINLLMANMKILSYFPQILERFDRICAITKEILDYAKSESKNEAEEIIKSRFLFNIRNRHSFGELTTEEAKSSNFVVKFRIVTDIKNFFSLYDSFLRDLAFLEEREESHKRELHSESLDLGFLEAQGYIETFTSVSRRYTLYRHSHDPKKVVVLKLSQLNYSYHYLPKDIGSLIEDFKTDEQGLLREICKHNEKDE